jgi:uncharacterized phage infection (PIP) family protein YhgE
MRHGIQMQDIKDQIEKSVDESSKEIQKLKESIEEYNNSSKALLNSIKDLKSDHIEFESNAICDLCSKSLLYNTNLKAIIFPCGHYYHLQCILSWLNEMADSVKDQVIKDKINSVLGLQNQIMKIISSRQSAKVPESNSV